MGQARELMDRVTAAVMAGDMESLGGCYAEDATAHTPDLGIINGRSEIVAYLMSFKEAFPDAHFEMLSQIEAGDTAVDEGYFLGTHTGPLTLPNGEAVPPTGKQLRIRECDVAVVSDGRVVEHRFYYDQMDMAAQLGLLEQQAGTSA